MSALPLRTPPDRGPQSDSPPEMEMHPRWMTVSAGVLAHLMVLWHVGVALKAHLPLWQWGLAALAAWWFVDVFTLFAHWLLDNYFEPTTPIVGTTVFYFREHHRFPNAMFDRDYFDGNFENAFGAGLILIAVALAVAFLGVPPVVSVFFAVAGLGGSYITTVHKWTHDPRPMRPVQWAQKAHLIVGPKHHALHHGDTRGHYALFAGHMEPLVEGSHFFEISEILVFLLTGTTAVESRLELGRRGERPALKDRWERLYWRSWYSFLAWYTRRRGAHFTCMNWGFDDPTIEDGSEEAQAMGPERYSLQLYRAMAEGIDLSGGVLGDTSCGRGGGLHWIHTNFGPASSVGVDFTPGNVSLCSATFKGVPGLTFRQGDAENMTWEDGSLRALLSVEASHCYPHPERFLAEAARVLEPGGWLLWTDFRPKEAMEGLRAMIPPELELVVDRDITPLVLSSMAKDGPRRRKLIADHASPVLRKVMAHFAAADDSAETVQRFKTGASVYFLWRLRKR